MKKQKPGPPLFCPVCGNKISLLWRLELLNGKEIQVNPPYRSYYCAKCRPADWEEFEKALKIFGLKLEARLPSRPLRSDSQADVDRVLEGE